MVEKDNVQTVYSGAQEPTVNSKSFREKLYGFFTYIIKWLFVKPKDVYEHPEISIEFKPNTVGLFSYFSDCRGKVRIKVILPENFTKLSHFLQTPHNTEILATFSGNHIGISNLGRSTTNVPQTTTNNPGSTQTETSMPNLGSTTNVPQTTTDNSGSIQLETSMLHLSSTRKAYQTTNTNSGSTQPETSMPNLFSTNNYGSTQKENEASSIAVHQEIQAAENEHISTVKVKGGYDMDSMESAYQTDENKASLKLLENESKRINKQRTPMAALKWDQTKRFVLNQNKVVLRHTAEYQIEGGSYSKDACHLYINERGVFSPAKFRHLLKNSNNNFGRWSLLSLSKSENHLHIERIDDLPLPILYQITEPLQNHKDGKQRKRLGDMLRLEVEKHPESELRRISPTNSTKGDLNIDDDIETDDNVQQYLESYIPEERIPRDPLQTVSSKEKQNEQVWTERTKMKQAKVKTRSEPTEFKIHLQSQDDEVRDLLSDFFRDDSIRRCVHDFFERDVDRAKKGVFERPHIQWPSMHPRLPFKLRYLDEHVEDSENGNQDHVQQQQSTPTASGEYNEESCSDRISVKSDSSDDEMK